MARTAVAITDVTAQPPSFVFGAVAADGVNNNMFLNDGRILLAINNPTGGALNVTIVSVPDKFGRSDTAFTAVSIAASATRFFGPFPQAAWNQTSADIGNVYVNPAVGLNISAYRLAATGSTP